jgi:hypothetical protein
MPFVCLARWTKGPRSSSGSSQTANCRGRPRQFLRPWPNGSPYLEVVAAHPIVVDSAACPRERRSYKCHSSGTSRRCSTQTVAFCESFNGTFRSECPDTNWFSNLEDAKRIIEAWRREYNGSRPRRALDYRTPEEFASQIAARRDLATTQTS